ncbi:hypothetical protein PM082_004512 [Marasmius tenuissimus]|nr:hypothetical protein PM082_004512 [Marasmius tenuissimus]
MSDSSDASKKLEETEMKAAGDVEGNAEPLTERVGKGESEEGTKTDSKEQDEEKNDKEVDDEDDEEEPQPPGFRNRGPPAYNSSGAKGVKIVGKPGGR